MRFSVPALAMLLAAAGALWADRHKLDIDPETEDGFLLQRIQQEPQLPRKLALLEKFAAQYPKAGAIAWVYEQLLPIYADAKEYDKVIATADGLLAVDPNDLDAAHDALRASETKSDPELTQKYAELSWDLASRVAQSAKPTDADEVPAWTKQTHFANDILSYSEYLLATMAVQQKDDQKRVQLVQALERRNSHSKYLAITQKPAIIELASMDPQKAVALAEERLRTEPDNEDFLMTAANYYMEREKDLPKVLGYALRVIEIVQRKAKPDDIPAEAWETKKAKYTGWANWIAGVIYGKDARYGLSDRYLRIALQYVREDKRLLAAAYFYLGYDNYALAGELNDKSRAMEAARFSKLCAEIDGPFQFLARKNLQALRNEFDVE